MEKITQERNTHNIDATDKIVGRLATQIAILLRGKHKVSFSPNKDGGDIVIIKNADYLKLTGANKLIQKHYYHHSGHPGGLTATPLKRVWEKNKGEVLRRAVNKMLPKNKLRKEMIKRLHINS